MSPAALEFHPDAVAEAGAAREWYAVQSQAAADAFIVEFDRAVELISRNPDRWPTYLHGTKRYLLRRFPYSIVYQKQPGILQVLALVHGRRRPGYWKKRK